MSFHRTTKLGRYLYTIHLWTLRKHSTLHGLCTAQTYKYSYDTWSPVEFFLLTIYSLFYPRTFKPPSVILLQVWTFYSSELRLHCHLCRARCAVSIISILCPLPPNTWIMPLTFPEPSDYSGGDPDAFHWLFGCWSSSATLCALPASFDLNTCFSFIAAL